MLSGARVRERGLFDVGDVDRLRRQAPASDSGFYHLWTLLLIEFWAQAFLDARGAAVSRSDWFFAPAKVAARQVA